MKNFREVGFREIGAVVLLTSMALLDVDCYGSENKRYGHEADFAKDEPVQTENGVLYDRGYYTIEQPNSDPSELIVDLNPGDRVHDTHFGKPLRHGDVQTN